MKKLVLIALLLAMAALGGCTEEDPYAGWEEDWNELGPTDSDGAESETEKPPIESLENQNVAALTSYNAEDYGYITPLELKQSQNDLPVADWAYSAFQVIEANIIKQGKATADTIDLSEGHFIYYNYELAGNYDENSGKDMIVLDSGDGVKPTDLYYNIYGYYNIIPFLARGFGPVSENKVPFKEGNKGEIKESIEKLMEADSQGTIYDSMADWLLKEAKYIDVDDRDSIKKEIIEKGAVQLGYYASEKYYSPEGAYYSPYTLNSVSHTATIIGWDDTYSKSNFLEKSQPKNDGAWLVYDSLGDYFGTDGHFWISYEDTTMQEVISYEVCPRAEYGEILSYDEVGYHRTLQLADEEATTVANIYTVQEEQEVQAIGIYTMDPNQSVEINVYTGVSEGAPTSGNQAAVMEMTFEQAGYHVVDLEDTVQVNGAEKFSVVLKYAHGETIAQAPIETYESRDIQGVRLYYYYTSEPGQSYAFCGGEWLDLSDENNGESLGIVLAANNACMKVLLKK